MVTATDETGKEFKDGSINRKDKNGREFPDFDKITHEYVFEAEAWTSNTGKNYFSPPKPQKTGNKTAVMEKMMDKKANQIAHAQDSKEHSIMVSSTMRDAVLIVTTIIAGDPLITKDQGTIKKMIKDWRTWLATNWDLTTDDYEPFPSNDIQMEGYEEMMN